MSSLTVHLITRTSIVHVVNAQQIVLPTLDGMLTIIPGRRHTIAVLSSGLLSIIADSTEKSGVTSFSYFVTEGVAFSKGSSLTITTPMLIDLNNLSPQTLSMYLDGSLGKDILTSVHLVEQFQRSINAL